MCTNYPRYRMKYPSSYRFAPRDIFARFFVACTLAWAASTAHAQVASPVTNASDSELKGVQSTLDRLERAALARDANALAFFGASVPADDAALKMTDRITHVAISPSGALVRQVFALSIERQPAVVLSSGAQELWLSRAPEGGFALTPRRFVAPLDAATTMAEAARDQWSGTRGEDGPAVLDLVASRIGGRWVALRSQRWEGVLSNPALNSSSMTPRDFLVDRMRKAPPKGAVTAHFMLQKNATSWLGVGAAYDIARRISVPADSAAALWRGRITGADYVTATSHRDFGLTLGEVGLWNEAADEMQKAELLQPGIIGPQKLKDAESNRRLDPQNIVAGQMEAEKAVGLGRDHPDYLISALRREQQAAPSVLNALRLALEYSRLADENRAAAWSRAAEELMQRGAVRPRDQEWVNLLVVHLKQRASLDKVKPSVVLRSALFTARVWPGDPNAVTFLAALEEAQHTVYSDFGIPMGNSEVLLWRNQTEFANYTTQFSDQGGSEFVAALTLSKLVPTATGPFILGEEINTFTDPRDVGAMFSTVAHEYGHVAVRQLSRGRSVPVWFNEGIASSVEGGYEGYMDRVKRAANAGTLLPMREMAAWQVDGARAFLAYSQANSIVDYIVTKWGKRAVLEILRQIGTDTSPDDAFRGVLGISQNELWNHWVQEGIS
jgi:hypothetical protein